MWWQGNRYPVNVGDSVFIPQATAHATLPCDEEMHLICFFPHGDLNGNLVELPGYVNESGL